MADNSVYRDMSGRLLPLLLPYRQVPDTTECSCGQQNRAAAVGASTHLEVHHLVDILIYILLVIPHLVHLQQCEWLPVQTVPGPHQNLTDCFALEHSSHRMLLNNMDHGSISLCDN